MNGDEVAGAWADLSMRNSFNTWPPGWVSESNRMHVKITCGRGVSGRRVLSQIALAYVADYANSDDELRTLLRPTNWINTATQLTQLIRAPNSPNSLQIFSAQAAASNWSIGNGSSVSG